MLWDPFANLHADQYLSVTIISIMNCLNCGKEFKISENYCSSCGQGTLTKRLTTDQAVYEFFHAFTHTDKGFFYLVPKLLSKPGIIAREYNEGKRKKYFSPFTFLLLIVAISTILVSTYRVLTPPHDLDQHPAVTAVTNFTNLHFNIMVFLSVPAIAFFTSRFFRKRINFAESLVLASYASGERSIFFILFVIPLLLLFKNHYYIVLYSYIGLFMLYYAGACCQYFNDFRIRTFLKGSLCFILAQSVIATGVTIAIAILIASSKM